MSISEVKGFGKQRGYINGGKPNREVKFLPKIKMEIVVDEEIVDDVIKTIVKLTKTGEFGSGKIFVIPVEDAVRIRTEESGKNAIIYRTCKIKNFNQRRLKIIKGDES